MISPSTQLARQKSPGSEARDKYRCGSKTVQSVLPHAPSGVPGQQDQRAELRSPSLRIASEAVLLTTLRDGVGAPIIHDHGAEAAPSGAPAHPFKVGTPAVICGSQPTRPV